MLFVLVVDCLDAIFKVAMREGFLDGIFDERRKWSLANLHFVDDTLLFSTVGEDQVVILKVLLYYFKLASGLNINFAKSSLIYLGREQAMNKGLSEILNCKLQCLPIKYLGLPLGVRGPSKEDWLGLIEKVDKKLASWKGNLLSLGGRLTLVNAMLSAIPAYFMSVYSLPV